MAFLPQDNRLILANMVASTPGACIAHWQTRLHGAWLLSINGNPVHMSLINSTAARKLVASVMDPPVLARYGSLTIPANCVNRTGSHIFYAISAAENMPIYGADVSSAFAEAPPPKQGFIIYPDRAFNDWWVNKKGKPPIPAGHIILV